jgi:hypothetical protein
MKFTSFITGLIASMLLTLTAFGGSGSGGGGLGKTRFLLQNLANTEVILTFDGITNIPESETTPLGEIPVDEYNELLDEAYKLCAPGSEAEAFVLTVEPNAGTVRNFALGCIGEPGKEPFFIFFREVKAASEKDAE